MNVAAVALVLLQILMATSAPQEHLVHIDRNGWATAPAARPAKLEDFERLWSWSSACAPAIIQSAGEQVAPCRATKRLAIRAVDARRRPASGVRVVWGTRALIQDVPDALLPSVITGADGTSSVDLPSDEPVFARVAGAQLAGEWRKVSTLAGAEVSGAAATQINIVAVDEHGNAASHVRASFSLLDTKSRDELPLLTAGDRGSVRIALPSAGASRLILWSDDYAPVEKTATNPAFNGSVVLPSGCGVRGTVVAADAKPIPGAQIAVTFPLGRSGLGSRRRLTASADGRFEARGIACGVSLLTASRPSFAPVRRELTLVDSSADLGRLILSPSLSVRVAVKDANDGKPVKAARVRLLDAPVEAKTSSDGAAILDGVTAGEIRVQVDAGDYLPETTTIVAGSTKPQVVRLTRGAAFVAHVAHGKDHRPIGPGTLWIDLAGTKKIEHFGADGIARISGLAGGALDVDVRVPGFASYKLPHRQLVAGDNIDFGTVELDAGGTISGLVVDAVTSAPIEAHIRVPRPNASGPRLSMVMNDWIDGDSDEKGRFQLRGLPSGDYRVLIEASGYAPSLTDPVTVQDSSAEVDAGVVHLSDARRLVVTCRPAGRCGTQSQLLLGDANDDWANLSAPMTNGKCEIVRVPTGRHRLRVLDRGAILAEKDVEIARDDPETTTDIVLSDIEVTGTVIRGGRPVDSGAVQFIGRTNDNSLPIVMDRKLEGSVVDSQVIGIVPRTLLVSLDKSGTFTTRDLGPGTYDVSYSGGAGTSPRQEVTIPDSSSYAFRIDLPASILKGVLTDEHGKTPEWARVEVDSGAGVISADMMPDGHFFIDGAPPGTANVRAFNDTSESHRSIVIDQTRDTEVNLTLRDKSRQIHITALRPNGAPAPGARLFLLCDGVLTSAEADGSGGVSFSVLAASRSCLGAGFSAADGWAFDGPLSIHPDSDEPQDLAIRFSSRAVTMTMQSTNASPVAISSGNGFPLERVFPFIGWPSALAPAQPLRLRGFPPGMYLISLKTGVTRSVAVDGTKDVSVDF
jgi:hypothetical protein